MSRSVRPAASARGESVRGRLSPHSPWRACLAAAMASQIELDAMRTQHVPLFVVLSAAAAGFGAQAPAQPSASTITVALTDPAATNQKLKLLWIACGKNDFLLKRNEDFLGVLKEKNLTYAWQLTEGDHSWPVWRGYLAELVQKLF